MKICALGILALGLLASSVGANDELGSAFSSARAAAATSREAFAFSTISVDPIVRASGTFIPDGCSVESWCLVKATDCFLGQVVQPGGLYKAYAQYSVVRRAVALCPDGYGRWLRRSFMGPVEPQQFSSGTEVDEASASAAALKLCSVYRKDWVDAAPVCAPN